MDQTPKTPPRFLSTEEVFPGLAAVAAAEKDCGCKGDCVSQRHDRRPVVHYRTDEGWILEHTTDMGATESRVYSDEWDHEFTLPGMLSIPQTRAIRALQDRAYDRGKAAGRGLLQAELRDLLGAAPLPRDEE